MGSIYIYIYIYKDKSARLLIDSKERIKNYTGNEENFE